MKGLWVNKKTVFSILLAGSIMMGVKSCNDTNDTNDTDNNLSMQTTDVVDMQDTSIYMDKNNMPVDLNVLNNNEYRTIDGDNKYTILPQTSIYYTDGYNVTFEEITHELFTVTVIETNGIYSYCLFPNNTYGYVNASSLIKCVNLQNANYVDILEDNEDSLSCNAYLYHSSGMYLDYLYEGQSCYTISTNGEYTLIRLPDGKEGYVTNNALMNGYKKIDGYAFLRKNTPVYKDSNLTNLAYNDYDDQMVNVSFINKKYAGIFDEDGRELLYVRVNDLDSNFILIYSDDNQYMNCYLDYQLAGSWKTRTGSDENPTIVGADDIDWKAEDWTFPDFPDCHARHLIVFNRQGQAIHDLRGDDVQNYGNQAYHQYGSHGCVRVPEEASEFVYNNYEVGDMVLVRKK